MCTQTYLILVQSVRHYSQTDTQTHTHTYTSRDIVRAFVRSSCSILAVCLFLLHSHSRRLRLLRCDGVRIFNCIACITSHSGEGFFFSSLPYGWLIKRLNAMCLHRICAVLLLLEQNGFCVLLLARHGGTCANLTVLR